MIIVKTIISTQRNNQLLISIIWQATVEIRQKIIFARTALDLQVVLLNFQAPSQQLLIVRRHALKKD